MIESVRREDDNRAIRSTQVVQRAQSGGGQLGIRDGAGCGQLQIGHKQRAVVPEP